MAHLTEQLRYGLLTRSLSPAETIAAVEHIQICASCRDEFLALRSSKQDSLLDQIIPLAPDGPHPSDDLLAAHVDDVLLTREKAFPLHCTVRDSSIFGKILEGKLGCDFCKRVDVGIAGS
jgi:hypothetical protein